MDFRAHLKYRNTPVPVVSFNSPSQLQNHVSVSMNAAESQSGAELSMASVAPAVRRRPKACDGCWKRKIRCDEGNGRCRNCDAYGLQCTRTQADGSIVLRDGTGHRNLHPNTTTSSSSSPSNHKQRKRARLATARHEAESYMPSPPIHNHGDAQFSSPAQSIGQNDPTAASPATQDDAGTLQQPLSVASMVPLDTDEVLEGVVTIENALTSQRSKYAGRSSVQMLAQSAEDLFQGSRIQVQVMRFFCPLMSFSEDIVGDLETHVPLLPQSIATEYVEAYFTTVHTTYPFLSETQFRDSFNDFYAKGQTQDAATFCCINLVLSLGARQFDAPTVRAELFKATWRLYDRIMASPYLTSVQVLILMTLVLIDNGKEGQAILSLGNAIRIAQSLGVHRALKSHRHLKERTYVQRDYHLRSCIWWVCYCLDKTLSFECGRPSAINDNDCDVDIIFEDSPPQDTSPLASARQTQTLVFPYLVTLCQTLSIMLTRLFSKAVEPIDGQALICEIETLDKRLLEWKASLPLDFQIDGELAGSYGAALSPNSLLLHAIYYHALAVIHRAALFGALALFSKDHKNPRMRFAEMVCTNAARALARILNDCTNARHKSMVLGWKSSYPLSVVFTLYIGIMRNPDGWNCDSDIALMNTMKSCLSEINPNPVAAESLSSLLDSLFEAIDVARGRQRYAYHETAGDNHHQHISNGDADYLVRGGVSEEADHGLQGEGSSGLLSEIPFENLLGLSGDMQYGDMMQLWPLDIDMSRLNQ